MWKQKKNPVKNVTPSGNRTLASYNLWFQVQHSPFSTNLSFTCKTETLGSLYSHALLILTKSSKSINQVVHKQKFKDQRFMKGLGSIPTRGNILSLDFFLFSHSKQHWHYCQFRLVCENPDWDQIGNKHFQGQSWGIVKKPLRICTRGSAKCIVRIPTSCSVYSLH